MYVYRGASVLIAHRVPTLRRLRVCVPLVHGHGTVLVPSVRLYSVATSLPFYVI